MRANCNLLKRFKVIWVVQSCSEKNSACAVGQITFTTSHRSVPARGTYRHRHETLGAECDGRDGVVARFWRARRAMLSRTAKSCGPGIPTLVSSLRMIEPRATVAKEPGHRGEHDISR